MKHPKILIVEDDDDIRATCREILEGEGFAVETCVNGKDAVAFLDGYQEPCLILLDMMMPIMNGREFMTAFSKRPHTIVPIPVYLVSAAAESRDGEEMGCFGFLKKPFNIDALLSIVRTHCTVNENKSTAEPKLMATKLKVSAKQVPSVVERAPRKACVDKSMTTIKKGNLIEGQHESADVLKRRALARWETEGGSIPNPIV